MDSVSLYRRRCSVDASLSDFYSDEVVECGEIGSVFRVFRVSENRKGLGEKQGCFAFSTRDLLLYKLEHVYFHTNTRIQHAIFFLFLSFSVTIKVQVILNYYQSFFSPPSLFLLLSLSYSIYTYPTIDTSLSFIAKSLSIYLSFYLSLSMYTSLSIYLSQSFYLKCLSILLYL